MEQSKKDNLSTKGLTLGSFLNLTEEQRNLINWMRRQVSCNFEQIIAEMEKTKEEIEKTLEELANLGVIEIITHGENPLYKLMIAPRKKSQKFEQLKEKFAQKKE